MFDWFWEFLYLLTKSIFRLIDGLVRCTNLLCGIEPIMVDGKETDMITWLISSDEIKTGFIVAAVISISLVVFFSIWGIVKTIVSEKSEMTPGQAAVKGMKAILTFLFVPFVMVVIIWAFNTIGLAMYQGTSGGSTKGLGTFLVGAFAQDARYSSVPVDFYLASDFDYTNTDAMWSYFDLSDFDYFYSWVAGIAILFMLAKVLLIFVDRMFSIVVLYVISPIPIAASVVDEGHTFKQWRDQIIGKFVVGYGAIIGINIYSIVIAELATSDIEFFDNGFINFLFKIIIILGGTFALNKIVTLVGNVFARGQAEQDLQNAGAMQKGIGAVGTLAAKGAAVPLKAAGGFIGGKIAKAFGNRFANKSNKEGGSSTSSGGAEKSSSSGPSGNKDPNSGFNSSKQVSAGASLSPQVQAGKAVVGALSGNNSNDNDKSNKEEGISNTNVGRMVTSNVAENAISGKKGDNKK